MVRDCAMEEYLDIAIRAVLAAGKKIMKIYNSNAYSTELKGDSSPLTDADKAGHEAIEKLLNQTKMPILSEEGKNIPFAVRALWNTYWLVDPLDGTKEFIKRNGEFTVNVALIEKDMPVLGVVYAPASAVMYFGTKIFKSSMIELDPFLNNTSGELIRNSIKIPLSMKRKFTVVGSRSHMTTETSEYIEKLKKESNADISVASKGSSLKLCMIANGEADLYPRFAPTMEWDVAAGHAVIKFSGGNVVSYESRNELLYNKESLLNPWFIAYSRGAVNKLNIL